MEDKILADELADELNKPKRGVWKKTVACTINIHLLEKARKEAEMKGVPFSYYVEKALEFQVAHDRYKREKEEQKKRMTGTFGSACKFIRSQLEVLHPGLWDLDIEKTMEIIKAKWMDEELEK